MVNYNIYGLSSQGSSAMHNCDNIYINGVYMDSFTFNHYQKDVTGSDYSVLLVICGGRTDNELSKELLANVRSFNASGYVKDPKLIVEEVSKLVTQLDMKYGNDKQAKLDVGIFAADGDVAYGINYGSTGIIIGNENGFVPFCNANPGCSVGTGVLMYSRIKPTMKRLSGKNRVLLYTGSVSMITTSSDMTECIAGSTVRECVGNIEALAKKIYIKDPFSLICMDIEAFGEMPNDVKQQKKQDTNYQTYKRNKVVAVLAVLTVIALIAGIIGGTVSYLGNKSKGQGNISGGVSIEEAQEIAKQKWQEIKSTHKETHEKLKKDKKSCDDNMIMLESGAYNILSADELPVDKNPETLKKLVEEFIETYEESYTVKYEKLEKAEEEDTVLTRELGEIEKTLSDKYDKIFSLKVELDEKCADAEAKAAEEKKAAEAEATPKPTANAPAKKKSDSANSSSPTSKPQTKTPSPSDSSDLDSGKSKDAGSAKAEAKSHNTSESDHKPLRFANVNISN